MEIITFQKATKILHTLRRLKDCKDRINVIDNVGEFFQYVHQYEMLEGLVDWVNLDIIKKDAIEKMDYMINQLDEEFKNLQDEPQQQPQ